MTVTTNVSREVRVATAPAGLPRPADLTVAEVPIPEPGPGQVLVRNRYFSVFAALRTLLGGSVPGAPFPALNPGDPLLGPAVGEVVTAPAGSALRPGQLVTHPLGWREYAVLDAAGCQPVSDDLPDPAAHLAQGLTAYGALTRAARLRPGEAVLVTGGAGSVGSMAGQLARLLGAGRVVGSTGSAVKTEAMTSEFGYDGAVVRGAAPLAAQLIKAAPGGFDVVLDLVGGEDLAAAVTAARPGARLVLVGALAGQLSPGGTGTTSPVELDSFPIIVKRLTLTGYSGDGDDDLRQEWARRSGEWLRTSELRFPYTRVEGMDAAPQALHDVLAGRYRGSVIVAL